MKLVSELLKEVRTGLAPYKIEEIAVGAGVSLSVATGVKSGRNTNPTVESLERLQKFIMEKNNG